MKNAFLFIFISVILFSVSGCFKKVPEKELNRNAVSAMEKTLSIDSAQYKGRSFTVVLKEKASPIAKSFLLKDSDKNFIIRIFTEKDIAEGDKISGNSLQVLKYQMSNTSTTSYFVFY
ncbi:MAG: hypothetical protein AB1333_00745 [Patescibacteria group bacterium]